MSGNTEPRNPSLSDLCMIAAVKVLHRIHMEGLRRRQAKDEKARLKRAAAIKPIVVPNTWFPKGHPKNP